jgi:hypothetical protein
MANRIHRAVGWHLGQKTKAGQEAEKDNESGVLHCVFRVMAHVNRFVGDRANPKVSRRTTGWAGEDDGAYPAGSRSSSFSTVHPNPASRWFCFFLYLKTRY